MSENYGDYKDILNCKECETDHFEIQIDVLIVPFMIDGELVEYLYNCPENDAFVYLTQEEFDDLD